MDKIEDFWNHRVVFHPDHKFYAVHEVFYKNGEAWGYTVDGDTPMGETVEELKEDLQRMLKCLEKPVLTYGLITDKEKNKAKKCKKSLGMVG